MSEPRRTNVLVASPLERELAERIAAVDGGRVSVIYEPELLPAPRYEGDHHGIPRDLDRAQRARWDALVAAADVMLDFDWLDPATLPARAPRLRWLQATSAGIGELLERTGLAGSRIRFTTAAGVHSSSLAEFALLGLLYFTKDLAVLQERQAGRRWERYTARGLRGQRVLLVGLGEVGREIARLLAAAGVEVWALRRSAGGPAPAGVSRVLARDGLLDALRHVDALVLACPLTEETRGLVGETELAALPRSAVLVNVARGAVVDEPALVTALRERRLRGAFLDVFAVEPLPEESPLWALSNVVVSPHSASTVAGENERIVTLFTDNLRRYLDGQPLRNLFDAERGY